MQLENLSVLIAEDDRFQRVILLEMLHYLGIQAITEATNGQEALHIIRSQTTKIDLIFSDLRMPGMDGMEFLRHLGEEGHAIEVVILSAMDKKLLNIVNNISNLHHIKLLGILKKPITLEQLKNILSVSGKTQTAPQPVYAAKNFNFSIEEIMEGVQKKQFTPYLQPKVDLKTGQVTGAEALARWIHPLHGVIAPYAFIPLLEQHEQIDMLTFAMLEAAAAVCKTLIENHHAIQIAVNLSLVSLTHPQMADKITAVIQAAGIDTQYIILEITESAAMTDAPIALENLARLYMNGFTLSIDDYGTGYSNLQQLTRIAFGELKIDQSFVQGFADNEAMKIVVASNVDMAHKLNIKSVAEGVETEQDWEMLRKMDCDIGQGYYIAKPMSTDDFLEFINHYRHQTLKSSPSVVHHFIKAKKENNRQYHILVIEHEIATRNTILKMLYALGYEQVTALADAQSAIDSFETTKFDLIITEIFMPGMNGLDLIKRVRTGKTLAKASTRMIALSGLTQARAVGVAMTLNVNGFLAKPLAADVIDKKIKLAMTEPFKAQPGIAYETVDTDIVGYALAKR